MDKQDIVRNRIIDVGLLPLFYHDDVEVCLSVAHALYDAGIRIIEFTNRGPNAFENFKCLLQACEKAMPGMIICVGTIKKPDDANRFIDAGAAALISPVFDAGISDVCYMNKILFIPGCMTPTEIQQAENAGCLLIKLFPANVLQPGYVAAIKPLFPGLEFMVTGGVETGKENLAEWFNAGVAVVGLGSKLINEQMVAMKDYTSLSNITKTVLNNIYSLKQLTSK